MTPRKNRLIWIALGIGAIALALLIARFEHAARETRAEIRRVEQQRRAVESKLAQARTLPPPAAVVPAKDPAPAAPVPAAPPRPNRKQQAEAEVLLERENHRRGLLQAWTTQAYAPFFRAANLGPGQVEAFRSTMIAHFLRWAEIVDAGRGQGVIPADQTIWKELWKKEDAQFRQEQREALGPEGFLQLRQFERTASLKPVADAVAGAVFDTEPLTADRAEMLIRVLANNSPRFQKGGQASLDDLDRPTALAQLASVLTPAQLGALQTSLAARDANRKWNMLLAKARKPEGN